jgi:hypothetical protein
MTLRATATSAVGGDQEIPKMGVLTPFTRLAISENLMGGSCQREGVACAAR